MFTSAHHPRLRTGSVATVDEYLLGQVLGREVCTWDLGAPRCPVGDRGSCLQTGEGEAQRPALPGQAGRGAEVGGGVSPPTSHPCSHVTRVCRRFPSHLSTGSKGTWALNPGHGSSLGSQAAVFKRNPLWCHFKEEAWWRDKGPQVRQSLALLLAPLPWSSSCSSCASWMPPLPRPLPLSSTPLSLPSHLVSAHCVLSCCFEPQVSLAEMGCWLHLDQPR